MEEHSNEGNRVSIISGRTLAGAVAVLALAGGGGALAATQLSAAGSPPDQQAFLDDLAGKLGVKTDTLTAAIEAALVDQVNAAVKAGTLTQAQADRITSRIQSGQLGLGGLGFRGPGFGLRPGPGGELQAAADYLGVDLATLRQDLRAGKSLADVAGAQGKSVDGLKTALTNAYKARLDAAVKAGSLTSAQEQTLLQRFGSRLDDLVNGVRPARGAGGFRGGGGFGPPPWAPGARA